MGIKNKINEMLNKRKTISNLENEKEIIDTFNTFYYNSNIWKTTRWCGTEIQKAPTDLFIYQEIINELKPDIIIETGTKYGGSSLFMAHILDIIGKGRIITIDNKRENIPSHPRIKYLIGNSVGQDIIDKLCEEIKEDDKVLVILDSDHSKAHVAKEIEVYKNFVSRGSYLIVEDTNLHGHPVALDFGDGPYEAVEDFMKVNNEFTIDRTKEKFYLTFNPRGFLKKR